MNREISLKDLLDTTFTINDFGEMIGSFTLERINMIGDILTQQYKEIERLHSIIKEVREDMKEVKERYNYYCSDNFDLSILGFWIEKLEILDKE